MAKKKRKYLKEAAEAAANVATVGAYKVLKCEGKGGKWVKGKCIPGSQIRTGKKKYSSKSPERSS